MIGLTLVTVVAVLGAGLNASTKHAVSDQLRADYVRRREQRAARSAPHRARSSPRVPGVTAASQVRADVALVDGEEIDVSGIDPATIGRFYRFDWQPGSEQALGRLGTDGALVTEELRRRSRPRGRRAARLKTPSGEQRTVVVRGIYDPPRVAQLLSGVSIAQATFDAAFPSPHNAFTFLDADAGAGPALEARRRGLRRREAPHRSGVRQGRHQGRRDVHGDALRAARLLRRREPVRHGQHARALGLRAHARARHAARDRDDAPAGAAHDPPRVGHHGADRCGARPRARALPGRRWRRGRCRTTGWTLSVPVPTLAGFTLVAVLAGIGAAILPARRASRLRVLDALHYE